MGSGSDPADNNQLFKNNVFGSLKSLGYDINLIHFDHYLSVLNESDIKIRKVRLEEHILDEYKKTGPYDYFFGFLDDLLVTPSLYKELKNEVFTINWSCNSHQFETLHKKISPHVDLNTYISLNHRELYDSVGAESFWSPMAASESIYNPSNQKDIDISFIGSAYGNRPYYIWRLLQSGIPLKIYGTGWKYENNLKNFLKLYVAPIIYTFYSRGKLLDNLDKLQRTNIIKIISEYTVVGPNLNDDDYADILSRSSISLNFPESRRNHDFMNPEVTFGCNFRDFEVPLSKTMLMTQDSEELDFFYKRDDEVIAFGNETDMIEKVKYYSSHESEARRVAQKGYERAIAEHTWKKRLDQLFTHLES